MNITLPSKGRSALVRTLGATLLCTLPLAAALSADQDPPTRTINYSDLNIHGTPGARVLYRRIRTAAVQVCIFRDSWDLSIKHLREECVKRAVDEAVRAVPSAELAALHGIAQQRDAVVAASR